MQTKSPRSLAVCTALALLLLTSQAMAEKPSLVDELEAAIDAGGAPALQQRFEEIWPDQKDQYAVDMQALIEMVSQQAQSAGADYQLIEVLSRITGTVSEAHMEAMMAAPGMPDAAPDQKPSDQRNSSAADEPAVSAPVEEKDNGEPRQDLQRFAGLYGEPGSPRKLFVSQSCDGFLLVGAMWGDVAPFTMVSLGDTVFDNNNPHFELRLEFQTNADGTATAVAHSLNALASPAQRSGDLPEDWASCTEQ